VDRLNSPDDTDARIREIHEHLSCLPEQEKEKMTPLVKLVKKLAAHVAVKATLRLKYGENLDSGSGSRGAISIPTNPHGSEPKTQENTIISFCSKSISTNPTVPRFTVIHTF